MGTAVIAANFNRVFGYDSIERFRRGVAQLKKIPPNCLNSVRGERKFIKSGYSRNIYGEIEGRFFMLSHCPVNPAYQSDTILTFHQSHFESKEQIYRILSKVFGESAVNYLFGHCPVKRIDFWLDIDADFESVEKSAYRPGVRWTREIRSSRASTYYGVLNNNSTQFIVYEKEGSNEKRN